MKHIILTLFTLTLFSCGSQKQEIARESEEGLKQKAIDLAHKYLITDGHIDLPYRLKNKMEDISQRTEGGDFDYVRAVEGGLDAPFMSIYIPARYQQEGGAKELADTLINMVEKIASDHPEKFAMAKSTGEALANFKKGLISLPMGMENGAPIEDDLTNVAYFHERGIRYITLTHGKNNLICDSSYDTTRTWNGLSPFGREVVTEMNRVGIMVDVSHISDSTFYQVMAMTDVPVIASHSSCRHYTPGFERNMTDQMIELMGEKGGVIQINFGSTFIDKVSAESRTEIMDHVANWRKENNLERNDPKVREYYDQYYAETFKYSTVQRAADHIDHVVELAGIDHVGFGSDFDGVGDSLPIGLKDVSNYPDLIHELLIRGYSEADIEKICYKNVFRVWSEVEKHAG